MHLNTEVRELLGDRVLEGLVIENNRTGASRAVDAKALFVFIGAGPCTGWLRGTVRLDATGYVRTGPAASQERFPSRPIRIVVPFPAGATTDMLARLFAQRMSETMGQSAVVENVGGAGGSIGADQVAKAAPDGHTLLFGNITFTTTTSSLLYESLITLVKSST